MKQGSRYVVLIHFAYEEIKAHGSQHFIQVIRLITGISGSRTQFSCFTVLCLLPYVTVLQVNPKLKTLLCGFFSTSWLQMICNFNNICLFPEKGFYSHSMPMLF